MRTLVKKQLSVVLLIFILAFNAYADETDEKKAKIDELNNKISELQAKANQYNEKFAGINFGIGMALTFKHGKNRIDDASIEGGKVRANREQNRQPKLMLETHYFFQPIDKYKQFGLGPFLGVEPDSAGGNILGAYALGGMIGLKREGETTASWNVGVGYIVNTNVKVLGDGIEEGKPLPEGETKIRYKEVNQPGWLIMASFSW